MRQLKVSGPISGGDLALIRHLAGYSPWYNQRNFLGHLEYVDLYDARLVATDYETAPDKLTTLATHKPDISSEFAVWRWLCNNYTPTFDAFYVRPSLYQQYVDDPAYTGSSWQRTNNVTTGLFHDDATFCTFAAHGVVTADEMPAIRRVNGWFWRQGIKDLTALRYTSVDSLHAADFTPLHTLEKIALPATLEHVDPSVFSSAANSLRYVDFMRCDTLATQLRQSGFRQLGITPERTLVYVSHGYGATDELNVVVSGSTPGEGLQVSHFYLEDGLDYCVPYSFTARNVANSRVLALRNGSQQTRYTLCLPYSMSVPAEAKVYKLADADGSQLVFRQEMNRIEAFTPYLVVINADQESGSASSTVRVSLSSSIEQTISTR